MTKNRLKWREKSNTYLTNVYRLPQSIGSPEKERENRSFQPTLAFISCRSRLTIMLAGAAK